MDVILIGLHRKYSVLLWGCLVTGAEGFERSAKGSEEYEDGKK
jgi:hypothetical protein